MGATITVRMYWFISSGETTRQGRVFLISLPSVGSKRIRWTSKREITISNPSGTTGSPDHPHPKARHRRTGPSFRKPRPTHGEDHPPAERSIGLVALPIPLHPPIGIAPIR